MLLGVKREWLWLIVWSAIYLALAALGFGRSLWIDEYATVSYASGPIDQILNDPGHPPGYYMMLWPLVHILGDAEWVVRFPSLLFGLGVVLMAYVLAKHLWPQRAVRYSVVVILATNPYLVRFGNEARSYTLLPFLILLTTYFYILAHRTNRRKYWCAMTVTAMLLVYIHYYGITYLATLFVYECGTAVWNRYKARNLFPFRQVFLSYVGIGLASAPLVPLILSQFSTLQEGASFGRLIKPQQILFIPINFFLPASSTGYELSISSVLYVAAWSSPFLLLLALGFLRVLRERRNNPMSLKIVMIFMICVLGNYVGHLTGYWFFNVRYVIFLLPVFALLISVALSWLVDLLATKLQGIGVGETRFRRIPRLPLTVRRLEWSTILVLGLVLFGLVYIPRIVLEADSRYVYNSGGGAEDNRSAVQFIASYSSSNMTVLVEPAFCQWVLKYYNRPFESHVNITGVAYSSSLETTIQQLLTENHALWYLWSYAYTADTEGVILEWAETSGYMFLRMPFGKLVVCLLSTVDNPFAASM